MHHIPDVFCKLQCDQSIATCQSRFAFVSERLRKLLKICKKHITSYCTMTLQKFATSGFARGNLTCYDCLYYSKDHYYVDDCQIIADDSLLATCSSQTRFCKVERTMTQGITIKLDRSCAITCLRGCRWRWLGLMQEVCSSCCTADACNTDNKSEPSFLCFWVRIWSFVAWLLARYLPNT
ncbi:unnamed protein product [Clavelina lepadiformis]|uniref:Uncharacterized protein n=1 Tax=Clavelina lepadiformis TaxID=159417 RepID=A0ABP0F3J0_CLALP